VIDDVVIAWRYQELCEELEDQTFHFVMLDVVWDELIARWKSIDSPFIDSWGWLRSAIAEMPHQGLWINPDGRSASSVADEIVGRIDEAVVGRR